jgi:hypothetical protein
MERKDIPLSDQAMAVAQAFDRLAPEVASKIAEMIFSLPQKQQSENYVTDDEHEPVGGGGKHGRRRS